jgi:hypothetical protein
MRMNMIATAAAGILLAGAAQAQAQTSAPAQKPAQPPASSTQDQSSKPGIRSINVVEINELSDATKSQVNDLVGKRTADEQQQLQKAIENAPMVKSAVEAKGFKSSDVLIAQLNNDGVLTVVTKRAG